MEKTISLCPLTVAGEEEINPKTKKLAVERPNPKESIRCKNLLKTMDPHSLRPPVIYRRGEGGGPAVVEARAAALSHETARPYQKLKIESPE
jgi:hypothetical protein